jgi:hypothetical protein
MLSFVFGQKFPGEKGSVRRCVIVMQQPVLLSPKFGGEVFSYFHAVAVEGQSSMRNWLFGLPGRILCEQSPWSQRKWWACSWRFSSPVSPFSVSESSGFPCTVLTFSLERSSNHCQGFRCTFSEICTKPDAHSLLFLSNLSRNRIRPEAWLYTKGRKKLAHQTSCVKFVSLSPKICWYYYLPLHRAITTAVQLETSVPRIMDTIGNYLVRRMRRWKRVCTIMLCVVWCTCIMMVNFSCNLYIYFNVCICIM